MNTLPQTVKTKLDELFSALHTMADDVKIAGAEAHLAGDFSQVTQSMDYCQRLATLENDIRTSITVFEARINPISNIEKSFHKRRRNHTRKPNGGFRVRMGDKLIERGTIADTFVETLKIFGLENVARLNKTISKIPLLSKMPTSGYHNQKYYNGWYITTHVNRYTAQASLKEIANELKVPIHVEYFER